MAQPLISVLVLTYHPDKTALFSTLRSIVLQKDCDCEIIVADDGSGAFYEEEIRSFLKEKGCEYQILAHKENQGTVKNILDGVRLAKGKYIKPISPGDFLYDRTTLKDMVTFMEQKNAKVAFGSMVFYACDPDFQVKNLAFPILDGIYRADRYSFKKAIKQQLVFSDFISGASAVYEKNAFLQALDFISPAVRYAEDAVFQLFALQKVRIFSLGRKIVWYEHGTGISTKQTSQDFSRIDWDFYNFYQLLTEKFPKNPYVHRAFRLWELRKNGAKGKLLLSKFRPDKFLFSLRIRKGKRALKIIDYNEDFFRKCVSSEK